MGMELTTNGWKDLEGFLKDIEIEDTFKELQFSSNTDWLIRVIKEIDDMDIKSYKDAQGNEVDFWEIPFKKLSKEEITVLFDKVVHFIKWWDALDIGEVV